MDLDDFKIDLRNVNRWYRDRFPNKDLISFEELLGDYEDLMYEVKELEEENDYLKRDMEENYIAKPPEPDPYEYRGMY